MCFCVGGKPWECACVCVCEQCSMAAWESLEGDFRTLRRSQSPALQPIQNKLSWKLFYVSRFHITLNGRALLGRKVSLPSFFFKKKPLRTPEVGKQKLIQVLSFSAQLSFHWTRREAGDEEQPGFFSLPSLGFSCPDLGSGPRSPLETLLPQGRKQCYHHLLLLGCKHSLTPNYQEKRTLLAELDKALLRPAPDLGHVPR